MLGRYYIHGTTAPGFVFLAATISIFSGIQLFALGVIGEYMARMYLCAIGRPTYTVALQRGLASGEQPTALLALPAGSAVESGFACSLRPCTTVHVDRRTACHMEGIDRAPWPIIKIPFCRSSVQGSELAYLTARLPSRATGRRRGLHQTLPGAHQATARHARGTADDVLHRRAGNGGAVARHPSRGTK